MFVSLVCGQQEIIHEKVCMLGLQTYDGMKAIYKGYKDANILLKPGVIFILLKTGDVKYNIGNTFMKKTNESIYIVTNYINTNSNVKIQPQLQKTWSEVINSYKKEWTDYNWFEDNKEKANELIQE